MGNTLKINMEAKPEILIVSLLLQIETPLQIRNGVTRLTVCGLLRDIDRQRATLSAEYPIWRAITGSVVNLAICSNINVPNLKQAYMWPRSTMATATSVVKSNYFRFATTTLYYTRHESSHAVGIIGLLYIPFDLSCADCGRYKISIYTTMQSDDNIINGNIILLPVRVRHVQNARAWLPAYTDIDYYVSGVAQW